MLLAFLTMTAFPTEKWLTITEDRIELTFNNEMKADDLKLIKEQLSEKNITINFTSKTFNKEGYLTSIAFEVDCNDGFSGSASSRWLTKFSNIGFYRDYESDKSFGTGTIKIK